MFALNKGSCLYNLFCDHFSVTSPDRHLCILKGGPIDRKKNKTKCYIKSDASPQVEKNK